MFLQYFFFFKPKPRFEQQKPDKILDEPLGQCFLCLVPITEASIKLNAGISTNGSILVKQ